MTRTALTMTDFLLARIAEDEDHAKRAAFGWGAEWSTVTDDAEEWSTVHADGKRDMVGCEDGDVTDHIARHDPARVLAECEAKREILKAHAEYSSRPGLYNLTCQTCGGSRTGDGDDYPCLTLRLLARPYADHPDYRRGWRP